MKQFLINLREIFKYSIFKSFKLSKKAVGFFKAFKFPILVARGTKISTKNATIEILEDFIEFGMVKLGTPHSTEGITHNKKSYLILEKDSYIGFYDKATLCKGFSVKCFENSKLIFGRGFWANKNCTIWSKSQVEFGHKNLLGWNVYVNNYDGHPIYDLQGQEINLPKPIITGEKVWIGSNSSIIKGVEITDNVIVGYNSVVTKSLLEQNSSYAGIPAKKIKEGINWDF